MNFLKKIRNFLILFTLFGVLTAGLDYLRMNSGLAPIFNISKFDEKTRIQSYRGLFYQASRKVKVSTNESLVDSSNIEYTVLNQKINVPKQFKKQERDFLIKTDVIKDCTEQSKLYYADLNVKVYTYCLNDIKVEENNKTKELKDLLTKEIRRKKLSLDIIDNNIDSIIKELKLSNEEELYLDIGTGKISPNTVINVITPKEENYIDVNKYIRIQSKEISAKNDILVDGIDEIKVTLANCCKPINGDEIVGYISRGNGVIVHSKNCPNLKNMEDRLINVSWSKKSESKFPANIRIFSSKNDNLLLDIITKSSGLNINITNINTTINDDKNIYDLVVMVENTEKLNKYIDNLKQIKDIIDVQRIFN